MVLEKENKNSQNDMESINILAEKSQSVVVDARSKNAPKLTSDNVIHSEDTAKIRKDAETA